MFAAMVSHYLTIWHPHTRSVRASISRAKSLHPINHYVIFITCSSEICG